MLRAMTEPALMTFSNIEAITFISMQTRPILQCFHVDLMFGLHTAQCIRITKRMVICFSTFLSCYGNQVLF